MTDSQPTLVVLGAASGPRHKAFRRACENRLGKPPTVISYGDLHRDPSALLNVLKPDCLLRFESPDHELDSINALLDCGRAATLQADLASLPRLRTLDELGLGSPTQLFFGLRYLLRRAASDARRCGATLLSSPAEMMRTFDKTRSQRRLHEAGVRTPQPLGNPASFTELMGAMDAAKTRRVFLKLRFGSAAAGMMAIAHNGQDRWTATSTARLDRVGLLRPSRKMRQIQGRPAVAELVDQLAPWGLHAEAWVPKLGFQQQRVDLRLVTIDGQLVYTIVRASTTPMTNLHLGGQRLHPRALIKHLGPRRWAAVETIARQTAAQYPGCLSLGIDVALTAARCRPVVLEVNAFGDFVKPAGSIKVSPYQLLLDYIATRSIRTQSESRPHLGATA